MFNFSKFFLEKMDLFLGRKMLTFLINEFTFLILWIVLKNETSVPSAAALAPDPLRGALIAFKWPGRSHNKNSWRSHCKFLNQIENFTRFQKLFEKFRNSCKISSIFYEIFLRKNWLLGKKNFDIFVNSFHFLILCIVLKKRNYATVRGHSPPDPKRGRVLASKWPGRSHISPKKSLWRQWVVWYTRTFFDFLWLSKQGQC